MYLLCCVQEWWEAEDALVVGFERVASWHGAMLHSLSGRHADAPRETVMQRLKQQLDASIMDTPGVPDAVGHRLQTSMENMRSIMEVPGSGGEECHGSTAGDMDSIGRVLQDMVTSLDMMKHCKERGLLLDTVVDDGTVDDSLGGVSVVRDLAMADCLQENLELLVRERVPRVLSVM